MPSNALADAFGDRNRPTQARIGKDERELISAKPGNDVGLPGTTLNDGGRLDQRAAARQMPVCIVDRFEAVEINEQQRKRTSAPRRAFCFSTENLIEVPRIV